MSKNKTSGGFPLVVSALAIVICIGIGWFIYKTILGLVLATSANFSANAQVSAYAFNQSSTSYSAISSGTVLATATGTNAAGTIDDAVYNLPTVMEGQVGEFIEKLRIAENADKMKDGI